MPVALGGAALVTALVAVWIALDIGGDRVTLWVDDGLTPLAALIACVLCVRAGARQSGRVRLFWGLLALATGLWTVAELIWGYYALILGEEVPEVSWADVGYLSAIPVTVAALVAHPATGVGGTRKARSVFDALVVATALMFVSWTLVLEPLWHSADFGTLAGVVTLAYPFGDVVIVFFVVLVIRGMTGQDRVALWILLAALLVLAMTDSTYTYLSEVATYTSSSADPIDSGWIAAYLGIALAAFSARAARAPVRSEQRAASSTSLASLTAPLLPVLLALTVAAVEIRLGDRLDTPSWVMVLVLIALVLMRQGLMVRELLAPKRAGQSGRGQRIASASGGTP